MAVITKADVILGKQPRQIVCRSCGQSVLLLAPRTLAQHAYQWVDGTVYLCPRKRP